MNTERIGMFFRTATGAAFRLDRVVAVSPADDTEPDRTWLAYLDGCERPAALTRAEAFEVVALLDRIAGVV